MRLANHYRGHCRKGDAMIPHRTCADTISPSFTSRTWGIGIRERICLSFLSCLSMGVFLGAAIMLVSSRTFAQDAGPVARWSFDNATGPAVHDAVNGVEDKVGGFYKYVPGVSGNGLRFDEYTTSVVRKAENAPKLQGSFSVEAWIALDTYPWNWVPIIDQEEDRQTGYFFGVDPFGHVGLQVGVNGVWQTVTSTAQIPLKKWAHLAGTYDDRRGLTIYLDGKEVGSLAVSGPMLTAEHQDLLIGRVREPALPFPSFSISPHDAVWYSLDGILDEVALYDRSLSGEQVQQAYAAAHRSEE